VSARFIVVFRSRSARLHLRDDGKAISSTGKAKKFSSHVLARKTARGLMARFPVLANYKMRIEALNAPKKEFVKNPSGFSRAVENYTAELDRADDKLHSFTGSYAGKVTKVNARQIKTGFVIGPALGVAYRATRDGETKNYFHEFRKKSQPHLISDSDGTQLGFVGGRYQFTDRGIEDK
jgi:hypothetical protein